MFTGKLLQGEGGEKGERERVGSVLPFPFFSVLDEMWSIIFPVLASTIYELKANVQSGSEVYVASSFSDGEF